MLNLVTNSFDKNILGNYDDLKEWVHYVPVENVEDNKTIGLL
jgi:hypothetical protein